MYDLVFKKCFWIFKWFFPFPRIKPMMRVIHVLLFYVGHLGPFLAFLNLYYNSWFLFTVRRNFTNAPEQAAGRLSVRFERNLQCRHASFVQRRRWQFRRSGPGNRTKSTISPVSFTNNSSRPVQNLQFNSSFIARAIFNWWLPHWYV